MTDSLTPFALVTDNETGAEYLTRFDCISDRDAFVIAIGGPGFVARVTTGFHHNMQGLKWVSVTPGFSRLNGSFPSLPKGFPDGYCADILCDGSGAVALPIAPRVKA